MTGTRQSVSLGPYNAAVRAYFRSPRHAGDTPASGGQRVEAKVSEPGTKIVLAGTVEQNEWRSLRFRVFGCPHLIAAAEMTCERFEGNPVNQLSDFNVSDLMEKLGVPIEKTGRILLLEDAVRLLLANAGASPGDED